MGGLLVIVFGVLGLGLSTLDRAGKKRLSELEAAAPRVRVADNGNVLVDDKELVIHLDGAHSSALHGVAHGPRQVVDLQAGRAEALQDPDWQIQAQAYPRSGMLIETYLRKATLAALAASSAPPAPPVLAPGYGPGATLVPAFFAYAAAGWQRASLSQVPREVWERPVVHPTLDALTPSAPVPSEAFLANSFWWLARSYRLMAAVQDVTPVIHFTPGPVDLPPPALHRGADDSVAHRAVAFGQALRASAVRHPRHEQARVMLFRSGCWYLPGHRFEGVLDLRDARLPITEAHLVSKDRCASLLLRPGDPVRQEDAVWTLDIGGTEVTLYFDDEDWLQDVAITNPAWTGGNGAPSTPPAAATRPVPMSAADLQAERDRQIQMEVEMEMWRRRAAERATLLAEPLTLPEPLIWSSPDALPPTPSREPARPPRRVLIQAPVEVK